MQKPCTWRQIMFRKLEKEIYLEEFILPFEGKLNADNRWVKLSKIIPWATIEDRYAKLFPKKRGQKAKPVRMALGAILIQEKLNCTDRETVEQIKENPYLQYFIGLREYQDKPPFDPSLMVHFRKRFKAETLKEINEEICSAAKEAQEKQDKDNDDSKPKPPSGGNKTTAEEPTNQKNESSFEIYPANQGKLILDATCAPADIRFPTDLSLLNEARRSWMTLSTSCIRLLVNQAKGRALIDRLPVRIISVLFGTRNPARKISVKLLASSCAM